MAGDDDKDGENPFTNVSTFTELYKKLNRKDSDSIDRLSNRHTIDICIKCMSKSL